MRRRSRAGGEHTKAQRRKAVARKGRVAPKAADPSSSSAAPEETKIARLTRERDEALEREKATARCCASSVRLRASWSRYSKPCWRRRRDYAKRRLAICCFTKKAFCD